MNIKIEGNRARTTSPYNVQVIRALNKMEGQKRWGTNNSLSFEPTPYNLEIWKKVFPESIIEYSEPSGGAAVVEDGLFDLKGDRPTFRYKTPPRAHQKAALDKLRHHTACGLFMDVGTGKSWTAIALMGMRWCEGKSDHVLLVAKNGVHAQWVEEQIPEHMSESVTYKCWLYGKTKKAEREFATFMNFDGLKIFAINVDALITQNGEKKIGEFLKQAKGTATIIVDESQDIKNISASRTKAALKFSDQCKYRMIMTGTPIAKNVVDLFSQFKFLDERILGHRYLTTFKNRYCVVQNSDWGPVITGHKNIDELYKKIDPYIFRITSAEALDLPPKVYANRTFDLSAEQQKVMKELKQNFFAQLGDDRNDFATVKNAAGLVTRLQQISCGYLPKDDGTIQRFPNPRMQALMDLLEQREGKAIIWCRFNEDILQIMQQLGSTAVHYYGGTTPTDRERHKHLFLDPKSDVKYLVASPEAAGTGLNLQGICRTNIYYSNSFNSLARWQSEGRTWRDGTTGSVAYFDLIARKSPDSKILTNLRNKKSISDLTLDDYRRILDWDEEI